MSGKRLLRTFLGFDLAAADWIREIRSANPCQVTVTFAGTGFHAGVTQFLLDGLPILNPELLPVAAGSLARGIAPAHPAGPSRRHGDGLARH